MQNFELRSPITPFVRMPSYNIRMNTIIDSSIDKLIQQKVQEAQYANQQQAVASRTPTALQDPLLNFRVRDYYSKKYQRTVGAEIAGRAIGAVEGGVSGAALGSQIGGIIAVTALVIGNVVENVITGGLGAADDAAVFAGLGTAYKAGAKVGGSIGAAVGATGGFVAGDYSTYYATKDLLKNNLSGGVGRAALNTLSTIGQTMDLASLKTPIQSSLLALIKGDDVGETILSAYGLTEEGRTDISFSSIREALNLDLGGIGNFVFDMTGEVVTDPGMWGQVGKTLLSKTATKESAKIAQETLNIFGDINEVASKDKNLFKQLGKILMNDNEEEAIEDLITLLNNNKTIDRTSDLGKRLFNTDINARKKELQSLFKSFRESSRKSTSIEAYNLFKNMDEVDDYFTGIVAKISNPALALNHARKMLNKTEWFSKINGAILQSKVVQDIQEFLFGNNSLAYHISKAGQSIIDVLQGKKVIYTDSLNSAKNKVVMEDRIKTIFGDNYKQVLETLDDNGIHSINDLIRKHNSKELSSELENIYNGIKKYADDYDAVHAHNLDTLQKRSSKILDKLKSSTDEVENEKLLKELNEVQSQIADIMKDNNYHYNQILKKQLNNIDAFETMQQRFSTISKLKKRSKFVPLTNNEEQLLIKQIDDMFDSVLKGDDFAEDFINSYFPDRNSKKFISDHMSDNIKKQISDYYNKDFDKWVDESNNLVTKYKKDSINFFTKQIEDFLSSGNKESEVYKKVQAAYDEYKSYISNKLLSDYYNEDLAETIFRNTEDFLSSGDKESEFYKEVQTSYNVYKSNDPRLLSDRYNKLKSIINTPKAFLDTADPDELMQKDIDKLKNSYNKSMYKYKTIDKATGKTEYYFDGQKRFDIENIKVYAANSESVATQIRNKNLNLFYNILKAVQVFNKQIEDIKDSIDIDDVDQIDYFTELSNTISNYIYRSDMRYGRLQFLYQTTTPAVYTALDKFFNTLPESLTKDDTKNIKTTIRKELDRINELLNLYGKDPLLDELKTMLSKQYTNIVKYTNNIKQGLTIEERILYRDQLAKDVNIINEKFFNNKKLFSRNYYKGSTNTDAYLKNIENAFYKQKRELDKYKKKLIETIGEEQTNAFINSLNGLDNDALQKMYTEIDKSNRYARQYILSTISGNILEESTHLHKANEESFETITKTINDSNFEKYAPNIIRNNLANVWDLIDDYDRYLERIKNGLSTKNYKNMFLSSIINNIKDLQNSIVLFANKSVFGSSDKKLLEELNYLSIELNRLITSTDINAFNRLRERIANLYKYLGYYDRIKTNNLDLPYEIFTNGKLNKTKKIVFDSLDIKELQLFVSLLITDRGYGFTNGVRKYLDPVDKKLLEKLNNLNIELNNFNTSTDIDTFNRIKKKISNIYKYLETNNPGLFYEMFPNINFNKTKQFVLGNFTIKDFEEYEKSISDITDKEIVDYMLINDFGSIHNYEQVKKALTIKKQTISKLAKTTGLDFIDIVDTKKASSAFTSVNKKYRNLDGSVNFGGKKFSDISMVSFDTETTGGDNGIMYQIGFYFNGEQYSFVLDPSYIEKNNIKYDPSVDELYPSYGGTKNFHNKIYNDTQYKFSTPQEMIEAFYNKMNELNNSDKPLVMIGFNTAFDIPEINKMYGSDLFNQDDFTVFDAQAYVELFGNKNNIESFSNFAQANGTYDLYVKRIDPIDGSTRYYQQLYDNNSKSFKLVETDINVVEQARKKGSLFRDETTPVPELWVGEEHYHNGLIDAKLTNDWLLDNFETLEKLNINLEDLSNINKIKEKVIVNDFIEKQKFLSIKFNFQQKFNTLYENYKDMIDFLEKEKVTSIKSIKPEPALLNFTFGSVDDPTDFNPIAKILNDIKLIKQTNISQTYLNQIDSTKKLFEKLIKEYGEDFINNSINLKEQYYKNMYSLEYAMNILISNYNKLGDQFEFDKDFIESIINNYNDINSIGATYERVIQLYLNLTELLERQTSDDDKLIDVLGLNGDEFDDILSIFSNSEKKASSLHDIFSNDSYIGLFQENKLFVRQQVIDIFNSELNDLLGIFDYKDGYVFNDSMWSNENMLDIIKAMHINNETSGALNTIVSRLNKFRESLNFYTDFAERCVSDDTSKRLYNAVWDAYTYITSEKTTYTEALNSIFANKAIYGNLDYSLVIKYLDELLENQETIEMINGKAINNLVSDIANTVFSSAQSAIKGTLSVGSASDIVLANSIEEFRDNIKNTLNRIREPFREAKRSNILNRNSNQVTGKQLNKILTFDQSELSGFGLDSVPVDENGIHIFRPSDLPRLNSTQVFRYNYNGRQNISNKQIINSIEKHFNNFIEKDSYQAIPVIVEAQNTFLGSIYQAAANAAGMDLTKFLKHLDNNSIYKNYKQGTALYDFLLETFEDMKSNAAEYFEQEEELLAFKEFLSKLNSINSNTVSYIKNPEDLKNRVICAYVDNYLNMKQELDTKFYFKEDLDDLLNNVEDLPEEFRFSKNIVHSIKKRGYINERQFKQAEQELKSRAKFKNNIFKDERFLDMWDSSNRLFEDIKALYTNLDGSVDIDKFKNYLTRHPEYSLVTIDNDGKLHKLSQNKGLLQQVLSSDSKQFTLMSNDNFIKVTNKYQPININPIAKTIKNILISPMKLLSLMNLPFVFQNSMSAAFENYTSSESAPTIFNVIDRMVKMGTNYRKYKDTMTAMSKLDGLSNFISMSDFEYKWTSLFDNEEFINYIKNNPETFNTFKEVIENKDLITTFKFLNETTQSVAAFGEVNSLTRRALRNKEKEDSARKAEESLRDLGFDLSNNYNSDKIVEFRNSLNENQLDRFDKDLDTYNRYSYNKLSTDELKQKLKEYDDKISKANHFAYESDFQHRNTIRNIINDRENENSISNRLTKIDFINRWFNFNEDLETVFRLSAIEMYMEEGKTLDQATFETIQRHFIYNNKSAAEQYAEFIVPFVSYPLRMLDLVDTLTSDYSTMQLMYLYNRYSWGEETEHANNSEYLTKRKARGDIPVGDKLLQLGNPLNEGMMEILNPVYTLNNKINPLFKPVIDYATGSEYNRWNQLPIVSNATNIYEAVKNRNPLQSFTSDYYKYSSFGNYYLPRVSNTIHGTLYNRVYTKTGKTRALLNLQPLAMSNIRYKVDSIMKYSGPYRG